MFLWIVIVGGMFAFFAAALRAPTVDFLVFLKVSFLAGWQLVRPPEGPTCCPYGNLRS